MRHARRPFLVATLSILVLIGPTYVKLKESQAKDTPQPSKLLDGGVSSQAPDWSYTMLKGDQKVGVIRARSFRSLNGSPIIALEGMNLELYHNGGKDLDKIQSEKAQFNTDTQSLTFVAPR